MGEETKNNNTLEINQSYQLEISPDGYQAFITVHKPIPEVDITPDDLKQYLKNHNVVYGIKADTIETIFQERQFDKKILIAVGEKVVDGRDGEIKYLFDPVVKPLKDDSDNINYKELNLVRNVEKGQKLAEVIPPVEGKEGCTVLGKKVLPKIGKTCLLPIGRNTNPNPENPNILIAAIDGHVPLKGKNVDVDPILTIKGDVDFSTGNINFIGSITINGDVKSGFSVKSQNDIQINGTVEDAVIEAGGNVLIKSGFVGRGEGKIIAKGKVMAKFCEKETIISDDDISLGEYAMHCNIQTKGKLLVTAQKGLVVGGEIYALQGMEAKIIGNQNYTPTKIFVGIDKEIREKIKEKKITLEKQLSNKKEIEKAQFLLQQRRLIKKELPEDKKILLEKLNTAKGQTENAERQILLEIENLENEIKKFKDATVKVIDTVYPGTTITIFNKTTGVSVHLKKIVYKYTEEEIIGVDLSAYEQK